MIKVATLVLIIVTAFCGCESTVDVNTVPVVLPERYEELSVAWQDMPEQGGLFLSYEEYRKLELNIINMRSYQEKLEGIILGDYPLSTFSEEVD